jgi:hypothetical protein
LSFLAMKPSRLETTCKVTFDAAVFAVPGIVPPGHG